MSNDDKSSVHGPAETPEADLIDASWDDEEPQREHAPASESRPPISERVTAPPGLITTALVAPERPLGTVLDDPLTDVSPDLDSETPSRDQIPIAERITPVHEPPPELLELDPASSRRMRQPQDCAVQDMRERYSVGDFTGALVIAESILAANPADPEATRYAQSCREVLMQMYSARLGALDQVMKISVPSDQIRWLSLDHRAGFMLSLVDGVSSVEEVLDICGMRRLDALRILYMLFEQRVIALAPRD
jgi:hypothetical protein